MSLVISLKGVIIMIEYADNVGNIYSTKDIELMSVDEKNELGLHVVDEEWMPR